MAIRLYRYIGNEYPLDTGILLSGVNVPQFPHLMTDVDITLLVNQFPHLSRTWEKAFFDDGKGDSTGGGNGNSGTSGFQEKDLHELLAALTAQMHNLNFL